MQEVTIQSDVHLCDNEYVTSVWSSAVQSDYDRHFTLDGTSPCAFTSMTMGTLLTTCAQVVGQKPVVFLAYIPFGANGVKKFGLAFWVTSELLVVASKPCFVTNNLSCGLNCNY